MRDLGQVRSLLEGFELQQLFIEELGWDRYGTPLHITVGDDSYTLQGIAEKRGMVAFVLSADQLPDHARRGFIEREVTRLVHEHLIVYASEPDGRQIWQWVRREPGGPIARREQIYQRGQTGEALVQSLEALVFGLDEEAGLTIVDVARRVRGAFDLERVTRQFYTGFKNEHDAFMGFIEGLTDQGDREWYASIMLNRLMFIYFIQKKGFLDRDRAYLRNRLASMRVRGEDQFLSFYRHFLLRLFHEGLGHRQRTAELDALLGEVPYLNGGLFDVHELEASYPDIEIPDKAFEQLFDFFDTYQWHLDDRPLAADNEVNPDVLGYIFEKYINQKQMGAYYTKEDITGYITTSAVVPCLIDKWAAAAHALGLDLPWRLLADIPDRYIPPGLAHGTETPLPETVAAGIDDLGARAVWNRPATDAALALPTETWREVVKRREHYVDLKHLLATGAVASTADLITHNLDIRQFAQDAIEGSESHELVLAMFSSLRELSVLDPTCGSGAFLFAALNALEPLYESCLDRMNSAMVEETPDEAIAERFSEWLHHVQTHPNRRFFVLKTTILNNLYGVDIMEEATEICKLRLFLKLVSQVDQVDHLEPLPDIDFNIRAGNALIGFADMQSVRDSFTSQIDVDGILDRVQPRAEAVDELAEAFRAVQTGEATEGTEAYPDLKAQLRTALGSLGSELDGHLASSYGVNSPAGDLADWCKTHEPLHWFVEFHHVLDSGGFDAIIGNPPYVEYSKVRDTYTVQGFETERAGDLYAYVMERSLQLLSNGGYIGMIVPVSVVSTDGFASLRAVLVRELQQSWAVSFAERPSKLFTGVEKRLTIWVGHRNAANDEQIFVGPYRRWQSEERPILFQKTRYVKANVRRDLVNTALPKIGSPIEVGILRRLTDQLPIERQLDSAGSHIVYYTRKLRYFITFTNFIPGLRDGDGQTIEPTELKLLRLTTERQRDALLATLNSNLFFWFFSAYSDVRNVNQREILAFRCSFSTMDDETLDELGELAGELMESFQEHSVWITNNYRDGSTREIQSIKPRQSKAVIDKIDAVLGRHYGFNSYELEFIVNFDFKYRMGAHQAEEDA